MIVTINSTDYETVNKYLNPGAVEKIHGIGVNLDRFRGCMVTEENKTLLRRRLGIGDNDAVLSYVAEINTNKNQLMLLEAFQSVVKAVPSAKLLLIGPEHDKGWLRSIAIKRGISDHVFFLGWRDDIPELLKISDVYVASSKSEGLGVNLIEAMACDLPVVAARNRGHEEVIQDGKNGFLVDLDDSDDMVAHVLRIIEDRDLKEKITRQAQSDIAIYETDRVIEELKTALESYL